MVERPKTYKVVVENPPLNSLGKVINTDPEAMWEVFAKERAILGLLPGSENWFGVFAAAQAVPEGKKDTHHFLLSPKTDHFSSIASLGVEELVPAVRFVMEFLKSSNQFAMAGFHQSNEPRDLSQLCARQAKGNKQVQQWANLHIHCVVFPEDMELLSHPPASVRDSAYHTSERVLKLAFLSSTIERIVSITADQTMTSKYFPRGGVLYRLEHDITAQKLALALKQLDQQFREFHEQFYSLFVTNYHQTRESGWRDPFILRETSDLRSVVNQFTLLPEDLRETLIRMGQKLVSDELEPHPDKLFYKTPAYTVGMFRGEEEELYLSVRPNLRRRVGLSDGLGIVTIKRFLEGVSDQQRRLRAQQVFNQVCAA